MSKAVHEQASERSFTVAGRTLGRDIQPVTDGVLVPMMRRSWEGGDPEMRATVVPDVALRGGRAW